MLDLKSAWPFTDTKHADTPQECRTTCGENGGVTHTANVRWGVVGQQGFPHGTNVSTTLTYSALLMLKVDCQLPGRFHSSEFLARLPGQTTSRKKSDANTAAYMSIRCIATRWSAKESWFNSRKGQETSLVSILPRPFLGAHLTSYPVGTRRNFPEGRAMWNFMWTKETTHHHRVLSLRIGLIFTFRTPSWVVGQFLFALPFSGWIKWVSFPEEGIWFVQLINSILRLR